MLAAQQPPPPEVAGEDESSCRGVFMEFMTKVAQFEELAESGERLLGRFREELEYFRRPQIPKESDVMNEILKSNCTVRMRSYIEAGCRLHCQNISNINQLSSCEERLKDHIKKDCLSGQMQSDWRSKWFDCDPQDSFLCWTEKR